MRVDQPGQNGAANALDSDTRVAREQGVRLPDIGDLAAGTDDDGCIAQNLGVARDDGVGVERAHRTITPAA